MCVCVRARACVCVTDPIAVEQKRRTLREARGGRVNDLKPWDARVLIELGAELYLRAGEG